ncbi:MAG TPA: polynucleotide kinase-phosphatase [Miltoncostaeaceae bacterium]|jgi:protein phosphatase|nr:polynucleotide kinase-phosphatase [Miltoncostaeaceae bacterium]
MTGEPRVLDLPAFSLVLLIGASGSGKTAFAARHFLPTEVVSSDACRALVADDPDDQGASADAHALLEFIVATRLRAGRLTVIDATNARRQDRARLIALGREHHALLAAIVLDMPASLCLERNLSRTDRRVAVPVIRRHVREVRRSLRGLRGEGFRTLHHLTSPEEVDAAVVRRRRLWNDHRELHGPFDIIGDVHGCCDELEELLATLGYVPGDDGVPRHPDGRIAILVGDLVDRGPRILDTVALVRRMVAAGSARCVPGNHDLKLLRALRGRNVQVTHGLDRSLAEVEALPEGRRQAEVDELMIFLDGLVSHLVLDDGRLVVAHAGLKEEMHGRGSAKVRDFALYGETTGESDEFGLPVRWGWAAAYRGEATVVYGHTPVPEPQWLNDTINVDTGCVFGGRLTALRYPERDLVSVPARRAYAVPVRPFPADEAVGLTAGEPEDEVLDIEDVLGRRHISTRLQRAVGIHEENAVAALEVMGRFAHDPRWVVYLPPTVPPSAATRREGLLEHPDEAFAYYRESGVPAVVCEEKHTGSRAVVVVCRDAGAARRRFGVADGSAGACYTRTARPFFADAERERELVGGVRAACEGSGLFDRLDTDWALLDGELMPWPAQARELLARRYAPLGAAARVGLAAAVEAAEAIAGTRNADRLVARLRARAGDAAAYAEAYRRYCWPAGSAGELRFAPFHLLATEGRAHVDRPHDWHLDELARLAGDGLILPTERIVVDVSDPDAVAQGVAWWERLTAAGGEGMVTKPLGFVARNRGELVQPALKTRGREYLRIIYGPEYTEPVNLERLRDRGLGRKQSLGLREFALGVEAVERFVRREPLRRVHECVFGVLALESEPVDPRL